MKLILEELATGFHLKLYASDKGRFDWLLSEFKETIPQAQRAFNKEGSYWWVEKRAARSLSILLAFFERSDVEVIRLRDFGPEADARGKAAADDPVAKLYRELFLVPGAPVKLVDAAKKILLVEAHPDTGGDQEIAVRINPAVDLIKEIEKQRSNAA